MTATDRDTGSSSANYLPLILAIILIFAIIGILRFLSIEYQNYLLVEGGVFETLTVLGYAACILLICMSWSWQKIRERWYFAALITLFALRELDFDKSQFTVGLLKSRQYVGDLVALPERIISFLLIILILTVIILILVKETRSFFAGIFAFMPSELAVMFSLILICITKSVDGLGRKLAGFNISISQSMEQFAYVFEEVGEMGIPVMFAVAIVTSRS